MQTQQRLDVEKQRLENCNKYANKHRAQSIDTNGQNEIIIEGIKIYFPFEPYQCQLTYMKKVIDTLQQV